MMCVFVSRMKRGREIKRERERLGERGGRRENWNEKEMDGTRHERSLSRDTTRGMLFSSNGKDSIRPTRRVTH